MEIILFYYFLVLKKILDTPTPYHCLLQNFKIRHFSERVEGTGAY